MVRTTIAMRLRFGLTLALLLCAGACGHGAKYYVERGNKLFEAGNFAEAELNYRKASQKDDHFGEAFFRAGLTELKENKPIAALADLDKAVALMPGDKAAQRELANLVLGGFIGDPSRPRELYNRLVRMSENWLKLDPQSSEGLRIKGYIAMLEKKPDEAVSLFQRAQQANPRDEKMNMGLMDALFRSGDAAKAEKVGLDFIATDKGAGDVYDALYRLYLSSGRPGEAEGILIRKVRENPKEGTYKLQLASYYASANKKTEMASAMQMFLSNPGGDPQVYLKAGDFYAALGEWSAAQQQYNLGLAANNKDRLLYQIRLARGLLTQNKRAEGLKVLNDALAEHPDDKDVRSLRAALLLDAPRTSKPGEALSEFKALVDKNPDDSFFKLVYAKGLLETGDLATARSQLQEVVKRDPHSVEAQVALANTALRLGSAKEAVDHANAALAVDSGNVQGQLILGSALLRAGRPDEAASVLTQVARQVPQSIEVRLQLAYVDLHRKKYAEAEAAFKKLLDSNPQEWRALGGMVDTDLAQNRPEKALARMQEELKRSRGTIEVRYLLASTALKTGKYGLAIENLRQLSDLSPDTIDPQLQLADVYRLKGDVPTAIATAQKAAARQPADPRPSSMMTYLFELQNRKQEAKAQARRNLELRPEDPDAMNNLAYLLADTGDSLDQALRLARKAVAKTPDNGAFADTLGFVYLKNDQNDDALEIFRNLVRKYPRELLAHYHLGMAFYQNGDRSGAKSELVRALSLNPTDEVENDIKNLLSHLN
jgi:tetratricopeptide (TPR) repeat protein